MAEIWKEFNLNDYIKVKLNDKGKDIYYHQYDAWIDKTDLKREYPKIDENGYTEFQAHEFIKLYEKHMKIGFDLPFEMNILIGFEE